MNKGNPILGGGAPHLDVAGSSYGGTLALGNAPLLLLPLMAAAPAHMPQRPSLSSQEESAGAGSVRRGRVTARSQESADDEAPQLHHQQGLGVRKGSSFAAPPHERPGLRRPSACSASGGDSDAEEEEEEGDALQSPLKRMAPMEPAGVLAGPAAVSEGTRGVSSSGAPPAGRTRAAGLLRAGSTSGAGGVPAALQPRQRNWLAKLTTTAFFRSCQHCNATSGVKGWFWHNLRVDMLGCLPTGCTPACEVGPVLSTAHAQCGMPRSSCMLHSRANCTNR